MRWVASVSVSLALAGLPLPLVALEVAGWVSVQGQAYAERGADGQDSWNLSIAGQPEWYHAFDDGVWSLEVELFARIDAQDDERTHIDLREAHALAVFDSSEWKLGVSKEFWGATEFLHLVDVINQDDAIENIDGEDKLGQPMVKGAWFGNWGTAEVFLLPGFRERTFAGEDGRLRAPLPVSDDAVYESGAQWRHLDVAARGVTTLGPVDLGLGVFRGTDRDPLLQPNALGTELIPFYQQITQISLDVTAVSGQALWKGEALMRDSRRERYVAATGGVEYTFVGVIAQHDIGLLAEYQWDERGTDATSIGQNDLALGARYVLNDFHDSELLSGVIYDLDHDSMLITLEFARRIGDQWSFEAELRIIADAEQDPVLGGLNRDDYLQVELFYHF